MSAIALDPLIAEAKERARRRRLLALAAVGILLAAAGGLELARSGGSGTAGLVPWLPTKPDIGPAHPPLAPPCTASQLKTTFGMQGLNMYEAAGGISLVNRSSKPCSLTGRPHLSFAGAATALHIVKMRKPAWLAFDPLAPPIGSLRALKPGQHVSVSVLVVNPCSADVRHNCSRAGGPLVFDAPGGGKLHLRDTVGGGDPWWVSLDEQVQASRFVPVIPNGPPSSALPLTARIVPSGPVTHGKIPPPSSAARLGSWLSYTVVLTNRRDHTFTFGRTCPAYTEALGGVERAQAYVLNCHAVGPIAPHGSVRFAMSVRISENAGPGPDEVFWTLAPHTWHAPSAQADVLLR